MKIIISDTSPLHYLALIGQLDLLPKVYFVLKASNGEVIGKSEMYKRKSGQDKGIASVQKNAPEAKVVDLTEKS